MKATIYRGIEDIELVELPTPTPGEKDVLIKVMRAGICGTDLHAYLEEGESVGIHPDNQFGHEFVGVVDTVGSAVEGIEVGTRVFIDPNLRMPLGKGLGATEIADMAGGFSEYMVVEEAKLGYNLYELPEGLHFDKAVLTEPISVGMHGVHITNAGPGDKAIVYGAGAIGLGTVAALRSVGVEDIIITDLVPARLEAAKAMGAIPHNGADGSVIDFAKETWGTGTDSMGQETTLADVVLDCAGFKGPLTDFLANAKSGSRFGVVALSGQPEEVVPYVLVAKDISIHGSRGYVTEDIEATIALLAGDDVVVDPMITAEFGLSQVVEAFQAATDKDNQIKVVINHEK